MQPHKKNSDNSAREKSSLDYSFLFSKLEQLSRENAHYRKAFAQIEEVANKISRGNLTARIIHVNEFGKITPALLAINNAYDFTENFILASEASQITALKKQDAFRKEQLSELKNYFKKQISPLIS